MAAIKPGYLITPDEKSEPSTLEGFKYPFNYFSDEELQIVILSLIEKQPIIRMLLNSFGIANAIAKYMPDIITCIKYLSIHDKTYNIMVKHGIVYKLAKIFETKVNNSAEYSQADRKKVRLLNEQFKHPD